MEQKSAISGSKPKNPHFSENIGFKDLNHIKFNHHLWKS